MGMNIKMAENREMVFRHFVLSSFLFTVRRVYCEVKPMSSTSIDRHRRHRLTDIVDVGLEVVEGERGSVILCRN